MNENFGIQNEEISQIEELEQKTAPDGGQWDVLD